VIILSLLFAGNLPERLKKAAEGFDTAAGKLLADLYFLLVYVLCMMSLARGGFNPFIYFQF